jgi:acyl-CoA thioesterase FadM
MIPTTLASLRECASVEDLPNGIRVFIDRGWIVPHEDRLSYATIVRLIECCREFHWLKDVDQGLTERAVDSICRRLECDFIRPLLVGDTVEITYSIAAINQRSYSLLFKISDGRGSLCGTCSMICVFYDPLRGLATRPDAATLGRIRSGIAT